MNNKLETSHIKFACCSIQWWLRLQSRLCKRGPEALSTGGLLGRLVAFIQEIRDWLELGECHPALGAFWMI
jgi:hypothetical protein